jgi:hypothetical protein
VLTFIVLETLYASDIHSTFFSCGSFICSEFRWFKIADNFFFDTYLLFFIFPLWLLHMKLLQARLQYYYWWHIEHERLRLIIELQKPVGVEPSFEAVGMQLPKGTESLFQRPGTFSDFPSLFFFAAFSFLSRPPALPRRAEMLTRATSPLWFPPSHYPAPALPLLFAFVSPFSLVAPTPDAAALGPVESSRFG